MNLHRKNMLGLNMLLFKLKRIVIRKLDLIKFDIFLCVLRLFKLNVTYNKAPKRNCSKKYFNVLYISESPEYADRLGWFNGDELIDLEISYRTRSNAKNLINPPEIYSVLDVFNKKKQLSSSTRSNQVFLTLSGKRSLPGHKLRHAIYNNYKNDPLFVFGGSGANIMIDDLGEIQAASMFVIVVENYKNKTYSSEKIYDAIWAKAVPVYYGAIEALEEQGFDISGIMSFQTEDELNEIVNNIRTNGERIYKELKDVLAKNRKHLENIRGNNVKQMLGALPIMLLIRKDQQYKTTADDWRRYF